MLKKNNFVMPLVFNGYHGMLYYPLQNDDVKLNSEEYQYFHECFIFRFALKTNYVTVRLFIIVCLVCFKEEHNLKLFSNIRVLSPGKNTYIKIGTMPKNCHKC